MGVKTHRWSRLGLTLITGAAGDTAFRAWADSTFAAA